MGRYFALIPILSALFWLWVILSVVVAAAIVAFAMYYRILDERDRRAARPHAARESD